MYTAAAATCLFKEVGRFQSGLLMASRHDNEGLVTFSIRAADAAGVDIKRPMIGSED